MAGALTLPLGTPNVVEIRAKMGETSEDLCQDDYLRGTGGPIMSSTT